MGDAAHAVVPFYGQGMNAVSSWLALGHVSWVPTPSHEAEDCVGGGPAGLPQAAEKGHPWISLQDPWESGLE